MTNTSVEAAPVLAGPPPVGAAIIAALKAAGIQYILSVPDIVTSAGLLFPLAADEEFILIRVCKEDEAVAISAGLSYCDRRSLVLIQYTGLLDSINAVRAVAVEHNRPIVFMVGLLEKEPGVPPTQSKRYGVRIVEPILDAMGIPHHLIETQADVPLIQSAINEAYATSRTVMLLVGQRPATS